MEPALDTGSRKNLANPAWTQLQALRGFVDGRFDYLSMRDRMLEPAKAEEPRGK